MRNHRLNSMLQRSLIALTLGAVLGLGAVVAGDTEPKAMSTILKLKNAEGVAESLRFDGALAVGESRGYETDAGTPVLVTRTEDGLRIELPSRTVNIKLPGAADADGLRASANVEKIVRIDGQGDGATETRVVVLHGDAATIADAEHEIERQLEDGRIDPEQLAGADGDETRELVIVRKRQAAEPSAD